MSLGLTTIVLFAVFIALLFLGCPISVGIVISSIVAAASSLVLGPDHFHHHAEDEQRRGELLPARNSALSCWQEIL